MSHQSGEVISPVGSCRPLITSITPMCVHNQNAFHFMPTDWPDTESSFHIPTDWSDTEFSFHMPTDWPDTSTHTLIGWTNEISFIQN